MKKGKYNLRYKEIFTEDEFLKLELLVNSIFANNKRKIISNNNKIKKCLKQVWIKGYKMGLLDN